MEQNLLESEANEKVALWRKTWEESKKILKVALPAMLWAVTSYGMQVVTQAFIGHISTLDLAAYALIVVISVQFSSGILSGMSSATETLCGQAFGAKQYHMVGIYLQRSWVINLVCATILVPVYVFATPIYILLGQKEAIAKRAGVISLWFIPYLYQNALAMTTQTCLQAQMRNRIVGWMSLASFVIHILLSWIFVYKLNLGVSGAMGAFTFSSWFNYAGLLVYILGGWCPDTWTGLTMAAFTDLWPVVKLSVSSGVMLCLEFWYTSVLVLLAGYLSDAETAISAFSICLSIIGWVFMVSIGFLGASIVRVSNELGRGNANAVRFSIKVLFLYAAFIAVLFCILALIFGNKIGYLFTSDEAVAKAVSNLSVFLAITIILRSLMPISTGVAIGAGRQTIVAYVNVGSYYVIGIPLGAVLAYVAHWDVKGMWIGMMCGIAVQTVILGYITLTTDYDEQVKQASQRLKAWFLPSSNTEESSEILDQD